jgi:hypothetical protein
MLDNRYVFFRAGLLVRFVRNLTFFSCKNDECEKANISYIILNALGLGIIIKLAVFSLILYVLRFNDKHANNR